MWKILFILCLYFFLHNPKLPIGGGIQSIRLLYIPAIYLVISKWHLFSSYIRLFKAQLYALLFTLAYTLIRTMMGGEYGSYMTEIETILDLFIMPYMFIIFANYINITTEKQFVQSLMIVGAIAAFITLLCLSSPVFNNFVRITFLRFEEDSAISLAMYRSFGISSAITSHYGYIQGTMVVLACYYSKYNKIILWLTPLLLLSGMVNARTSALVAIVGVAIYLFSNKNIKNSLIFSIVALFAYFNIDTFFSIIGIQGETAQWLQSFSNQIDDIFTGGSLKTGTTGELIEDMWIMPRNADEWLFGIGKSVFNTMIQGQRSDVGYVNQIMYGGILYIIPLFSYIYVVSWQLWKTNLKQFALFFILTFLILNLKCRYLPNGGELHLLMLYSNFIIYVTHRNSIIKGAYAKYSYKQRTYSV